jgi:hypothetical protein
MSRQTFFDELIALGYAPKDLGEGKVAFPFPILVGPRAGTDASLGFVIGDDYPLNPPGGPHFSAPLMPLNPNGGEHPRAGIHASPFGDGWQYWSRPVVHWTLTKRRASDIIAHVNHLLETLPP